MEYENKSTLMPRIEFYSTYIILFDSVARYPYVRLIIILILFTYPCYHYPCIHGAECELDWIHFVSIFKRTGGYSGRYCETGKPYSNHLWLIHFDKNTYYE